LLLVSADFFESHEMKADYARVVLGEPFAVHSFVG
jgi:hypothetical protein